MKRGYEKNYFKVLENFDMIINVEKKGMNAN